MKRFRTLIMLAFFAPTLLGCLERRIHITSNPSGALVELNDVNVGVTPLEVDFTYYGVYDVRLSKPGFEPIATSARAKAPLYEAPVLDIFAELFPRRIVTDINWHYELEPEVTDPDALVEHARSLRSQLQTTPDDAETGNADDADEASVEDQRPPL